MGALVFDGFKGGFGMVLPPTFGFILSFILVAYVSGKIRVLNSSYSSYIIAALVGMFISYVFGTNWLYAAYKLWFGAPPGFSYQLAWLWMIVPLPKDILLAIGAVVFSYRLEKQGITIRNTVTRQIV